MVINLIGILKLKTDCTDSIPRRVNIFNKRAHFDFKKIWRARQNSRFKNNFLNRKNVFKKATFNLNAMVGIANFRLMHCNLARKLKSQFLNIVATYK